MKNSIRSDDWPKLTAGDIVRLVCVVIFPSPQGRGHFGVVLPGLWKCIRWSLAKGILEGAGLQENTGMGYVGLL